jgi:KUP system potassium uptake protein
MLSVTVLITEAPRIPAQERAEVVAVTDSILRVILRFGFMEHVSVPEGLRCCALKHELLRDIAPEKLSYYIGHETVIATGRMPGMAMWRQALFGFLQRNAEQSAAYFSVPAAQVVEVGWEIEI